MMIIMCVCSLVIFISIPDLSVIPAILDSFIYCTSDIHLLLGCAGNA